MSCGACLCSTRSLYRALMECALCTEGMRRRFEASLEERAKVWAETMEKNRERKKEEEERRLAKRAAEEAAKKEKEAEKGGEGGGTSGEAKEGGGRGRR